jgi:hypothetical protein
MELMSRSFQTTYTTKQHNTARGAEVGAAIDHTHTYKLHYVNNYKHGDGVQLWYSVRQIDGSFKEHK